MPVEGRHPSSDSNHGQDDAGYDSEEEERDLHHQDMYMNGGRNGMNIPVCNAGHAIVRESQSVKRD